MQKTILLLFTLFLSIQLFSQNNNDKINYTKGKYLGTTSLKPESATKNKLSEIKKQYKEVPNFKANKLIDYDHENSLPIGGDPITQSVVKKKNQMLIDSLMAVEGINASDANGISPPDVNGDVGKNYYVQTTNGGNASLLKIFDKKGNVVMNTDMSSIWEPLGVSVFGDPIILYDRFSERWIFSEFSFFESETYLAISKTSDPMGEFDAYVIPTKSFPDYPKFGAWTDAIYMTSNEYNGFNPVYAIDKEALLNGEPTVTVIEFEVMEKYGSQDFFHTNAPIDYSGSVLPPESTPWLAIRMFDDGWDNENGEDRLEYYTFEPNFDDPNASITSGPFDIPVAPFETDLCDDGLFTCTTQSNGSKISVIPNTIMNKVQYFNYGTFESMFLNFAVDVNGENQAGIRWVELRKEGPDQDWSVYQESTLMSDDGSSLFMGSISQNVRESIAMVYAKAGPEVDPSIWIAARSVDSPLGEFVDFEELVTGSRPSPTYRWGDYFAMTLDPENSNKLWFTGEYMTDEFDWNTKVGSLVFRRDSFDVEPSVLVNPTSKAELTDSETVEFTLRNPGVMAVSNVPVDVYLDGELLGSTVYEDTIQSQASVSLQLAETADLSEIKTYEFTIISKMENDQFMANDTLITVVENIPRFDISANFNEIPFETGCTDSLTLDLVVANEGFDTITNFILTIQLNEELIVEDTITDVEIVYGGSYSYPVNFAGFVPMENEIVVSVRSPNGEEDFNMEDNTFTRTYFMEEGTNIELHMNTDEYGEEVSWTLRDENDDIVYSGNGYPNGIEVDFIAYYCLSEGCYTFNIFDSFGDGWQTGTDTKYCEIILGNEGKVIMMLDDISFGDMWTGTFCIPEQCALEAEVTTVLASAQDEADGEIIIDVVTNGFPVEFSIDGGENFQDENIFEDLLPGDYDVIVRYKEDVDCNYTEATTVDFEVATKEINNEGSLLISPNPTSGYVTIQLTGVDAGDFVPFVIMDQSGRQVRTGELARFKDGYFKELVLLQNPSGAYYIYLKGTKYQKAHKIIMK